MRLLVWGSLFSMIGAVTYASDAHACGGCFAPPVQGNDTGTIVTSHRMALSISKDQTVLWDQIQYTGSPAEFAWVLPIKPGARIEVASQAWFDVLDAATGTTVSPPLLRCEAQGAVGCSVAPGLGSATFGCSASEALGGIGGPAPDAVQVVSHVAAGPYESVILQSDVPGALSAWLDSHGYAIPDDVVPIIDAYQSEGFNFAALRLLPSSGVQQMRPIRVVQSGASPVLPLRMVAAGTGARTAITLFVIAEGRYTTKNIPEVPVHRSLVNWDFLTESSNYALVRDLAYGGGEVFFSPYAEPDALFDEVDSPVTFRPMRYVTTNNWENYTIAEAFVEQALVNGETSSTDCVNALEALVTDNRKVVMPCEDPADPETCTPVNPATEIDARSLWCDPPLGSDIPLDDMAQAVVGMRPSEVWVTRLEANLKREVLGTDLELEAADVQESTPGNFQAASVTNIPLDCELPKGAIANGESGTHDLRGPGLPLAAVFGAALGFFLFLRRLAAAPKRHRAWGGAR